MREANFKFDAFLTPYRNVLRSLRDISPFSVDSVLSEVVVDIFLPKICVVYSRGGAAPCDVFIAANLYAGATCD